MLPCFKLRCALFGHENDVRAVSPLSFPEGAFVSGSRDVTARVWVPNEEDQGFREGLVLGGHSGFVSAVCVLPPDQEFPNGLIVTGSNDHSINAYTLDSPEPVYRLTEHTDNVCSLFAGKFGTLLSGSWDKTAKVWLKRKCVMTLKAHEAAVWGVAIMPEGGYMLTGSADKTIKLWKAGKCECSFVGHTDCVRGVVVLNGTDFLSCSNDSTIRQWSIKTRTCLHVYNGHSSFVYGLSVMPNGMDFVSCGEDRTIRVWSEGVLKQTIANPAQSVWCVCVLPNGDIVTGGSDAVVRVFTLSTERVASDTELEAFDEQLSASTIPAQIGDIKTEDLVTPEALGTPGRRDGQTMMVRTGSAIEAHQWSEAEQKWIKIGNVTGGTSEGEIVGSGAKTHYQGKDYDYVFNVEIYEDKPPLKLPYNVGEDPWVAAHNFLDNNNISQMFLDQVAGFIQKQTGGVTLGATPVSMDSDPFTGSGRYVPGSVSSEAVNVPSSTDPFTGSNRYVPPSEVSDSPAAETFSKVSYFPETKYIYFEQFKLQPIFDKLREFNSSKALGSHQISEYQIKSLEDLVQGKTQATPDLLEVLWHLMQWPSEILLPVLDVLRLVLRDSVSNGLFCKSSSAGSRLIGYACSIFNDKASAEFEKNSILMARVLCNAFRHPAGEQLMLECGERLLAVISMLLNKPANSALQVACVSVILNLSVGYCRASFTGGRKRCISAAVDLTVKLNDPEAQFRLIVAIGTAVGGIPELIIRIRSLDISPFLNACQSSTVDKLKVAACQLQQLGN